MTLSKLFSTGKYNTDKGQTHDYINAYYSELFEGAKNVKLLEVGILQGESLKLWRDHFGEGSEIWGIDATVQKPAVMVEDCFIMLGNAYDKKYVDKLPNKFDFIIDDGIHSKEAHKKFVELYAPKVKKGGRLIIEDLQDFQELDEVMGYCPKGWTAKFFDLRSNKGRFDDVIIEFTK